jgi:hypothetical protein
MSKRTPTRKIRSAYEFIKRHQHQHNVRTMCRLLGVAPSGICCRRGPKAAPDMPCSPCRRSEFSELIFAPESN